MRTITHTLYQQGQGKIYIINGRSLGHFYKKKFSHKYRQIFGHFYKKKPLVAIKKLPSQIKKTVLANKKAILTNIKFFFATNISIIYNYL